MISSDPTTDLGIDLTAIHEFGVLFLMMTSLAWSSAMPGMCNTGLHSETGYHETAVQFALVLGGRLLGGTLRVCLQQFGPISPQRGCNLRVDMAKPFYIRPLA